MLGATGMLGSMVLDYLASVEGYDLVATTRASSPPAELNEQFREVRWARLDAAETESGELDRVLEGCDWAINAIGLIKPYVRDDNLTQAERAIRVNSIFPHALAGAAARHGCTVLQIATDCVYSGRRGDYSESAAHDALDVYGKSKSLGEARSDAARHLRVSIVGYEPKAYVSLLEWFLRQEQGAEVGGFRNHRWNGVTTLQFAKLCRGVIDQELNLPRLHHVVPGDTVTKLELLLGFARAFDRDDLTIKPTDAAQAIDRTLATENPELNRRLWSAAGYGAPPTIDSMLSELAAYDYRLRDALA